MILKLKNKMCVYETKDVKKCEAECEEKREEETKKKDEDKDDD